MSKPEMPLICSLDGNGAGTTGGQIDEWGTAYGFTGYGIVAMCGIWYGTSDGSGGGGDWVSDRPHRDWSYKFDPAWVGTKP